MMHDINTSNLISKLPLDFQLSKSELKLISILESDLSIPHKQIKIFEIQQKRFLIDMETDLTTDDILRSKAASIRKKDINKILLALSTIIESDNHIGRPYYYLFKNWFESDFKKEHLASLIFSMIQVGLKQQRNAFRKYEKNKEINMEEILEQGEKKEAANYLSSNDNLDKAIVTEANFIYLVSKSFLNTFLQLDIGFKRQEIEKSKGNLSKNSKEIPDKIKNEVKFKNNKFDIQTVIKHIGRRNQGLASQKKGSGLTSKELSLIDKEIEKLKQISKELRKRNSSVIYKTPELTKLSVSELKLYYGFITWKDQIELGNVIKDLLLQLGYIEKFSRERQSDIIQPSSYLLQRYNNWVENTLLPIIDPTGLKIETCFPPTVVWKDSNNYIYYEDPLIHQRSNLVQEIEIKQERITTLQTQMQQIFIIDDKILYEILESRESLTHELIKFIRSNSLKPKEDIERCINFSNYEEYESAKPLNINKQIWNWYYTLYKLQAVEFYQTLKIAIMFRKYKLYFPLFLDSRSRLYTQGWPLHPQGRKEFTRKFLRFEGSNMWENDVHAQGLQMWAILANEHLILQYTGLLSVKEGECMVKRKKTDRLDLYSYIGLEYNDLLKKEIESWRFGDQTNIEKVNKIIDLMTQRNLSKYLIMCFVYSEGTKSRAKRILSNDLIKEQFNLLSDNTNYVFEKNGKLYKNKYMIIIILAELLVKLMNDKFPKIQEFQRMFIKLIKAIQKFKTDVELKEQSEHELNWRDYNYKWVNQKETIKNLKANIRNSKNSQIMLSWHHTFKTENVYQLEESKYVQLGVAGTYRRVTFKRNITDENSKPILDPKKFRSSVLPNFLHCGDAALVHFVLKEFHKSNRCIWTVHDAFYTTEESREFARQAYLKAIKTLFEEDPIKQFVCANNLEWSDIPVEFQKFFDRKHFERRLLISQFTDNEVLG